MTAPALSGHRIEKDTFGKQKFYDLLLNYNHKSLKGMHKVRWRKANKRMESDLYNLVVMKMYYAI